MNAFFKLSQLLLAVLLVGQTGFAVGAEAEIKKQNTSKSKPVPVTVADPEIPLDELDIIAAPLTVKELHAEAEGWLKLVKKAAHKVAETKLRIAQDTKKQEKAEAQASQKDGDPDGRQDGLAQSEPDRDQKDAGETLPDGNKEKALEELTILRNERTALIDRLNVILDRINQKIGYDENNREKEDVLVYRRYIDAVGGIKVDVKDAKSAFASVKGWLTSKEGGIRWGINIITFLGIVIAFWLLAYVFAGVVKRGLRLADNQSQLLSQFLVGMIKRITVIIGIIVALTALEVNIGPLIAAIGAAGFVVAFALQKTLSNFASGIMIMLYRPFDVGDSVEAGGVSGAIHSLNLVSTTIDTPDNKRMIVPNNDIWGNVIVNSNARSERRVDMVFSIAHAADINRVKQILEEVVSNHPLVLEDPVPVIQLHEFADSGVNFICRPWAKTEDYWTVYWDVTREVKERFDAEGISFPEAAD